MASVGDEEELEMDEESGREMEMHTLNQLNSLLKPDRRAPKRAMPCGLTVHSVPESSIMPTSGPDNFDFNMRLIREVRDRAYLYDSLAEAYNNPTWRTSAWNEVAIVLDCTADQVKTRWKTLRDKFKKEDKKIGPNGISNWPYYEAMEFLMPHLRDKNFPGLPPPQQQQQPEPLFRGGRGASCSKWMEGKDTELDHSEEKRMRVGLSLSSVLDTDDLSSTGGGEEREEEREAAAAARAEGAGPAASNGGGGGYHMAHRQTGVRHYASSASFVHHSGGSPGAAGMRWNPQDEDDVFGHMIALRLAKMEQPFKEAVKVKLMQTLYDAQFGSESPQSTTNQQ